MVSVKLLKHYSQFQLSVLWKFKIWNESENLGIFWDNFVPILCQSFLQAKMIGKGEDFLCVCVSCIIQLEIPDILTPLHVLPFMVYFLEIFRRYFYEMPHQVLRLKFWGALSLAVCVLCCLVVVVVFFLR